jgi:hypothetical protein
MTRFDVVCLLLEKKIRDTADLADEGFNLAE